MFNSFVCWLLRLFSIFRIEHKLYISAQNSKDLALRMLKNGQRINVSGYIRSHSFSKTFLRISNVLAGCRISIIPKTIQLSDDEVDYMDKCIAILQGHVRSDLQCDADSCKFVLETRMTERFKIWFFFFLTDIWTN